MTVYKEKTTIQHAVDGEQTVFIFDFRIDEAIDAKVYFDSVLQTSGYTVNGLGEEAGGNVTFDTPPSASVNVLTITRKIDLTQGIKYQPYGPFPAASHEFGLDNLTMIAQQLEKGVFRLPDYIDDTFIDTEVEPVANNLIGWNEDGSSLINYPSASVINALYYQGDIRAEATDTGITVYGITDDPSEGGQIVLDGAGTNPNWIVDAYNESFRVTEGSNIYLSIAKGFGVASYYANVIAHQAIASGIRLGASNYADMFISGANLRVVNLTNGGGFSVEGYDGGGDLQTLIAATPEDSVILNHNGIEAIRTVDRGGIFGNTFKLDYFGVIQNLTNGLNFELSGFSAGGAPRTYMSFNPDGSGKWNYNNNEVLRVENGEIVVGNLNPSAAINLYNPAATGAWRIQIEGTDLVFQRRELGSWVTKQTISS